MVLRKHNRLFFVVENKGQLILLIKNSSFLRAQKVLKCKIAKEVIVIFVKNLKKGIK